MGTKKGEKQLTTAVKTQRNTRKWQCCLVFSLVVFAMILFWSIWFPLAKIGGGGASGSSENSGGVGGNGEDAIWQAGLIVGVVMFLIVGCMCACKRFCKLPKLFRSPFKGMLGGSSSKKKSS